MRYIDNLLNRITMYRLTLYYLIALIVYAAFFGAIGKLAYSPLNLAVSSLFILAVCLAANKVFVWAYHAPENYESAYITALILALLIAPTVSLSNFMFMFWASVLAIGSKFILAISKKHLFNPAAIALVVTALAVNQSAVWWVGNIWMLPAVLVGGLLLVRKIQREDLVFTFITTAVAVTLFFGVVRGSDTWVLMKEELAYSPLFFFSFVMLTEPLTTPPTKRLQMLYGGLVGVLFAPLTHFGSFYFTPEMALVAGNVFSYVVSPKHKLVLRLKEKIQLSEDIYDFVFELSKPMKYRPGQYMEWTLGHKADARGNRRYFTLASSPTEPELRLGVKFYKPSSSFKKNMLQLREGSTLVGAQLAGDFTLPHDPKERSVFIAGGIGITPFRSMIKYLVDKNEKRDITVFFSNRTVEEIVYVDVLWDAYKKLGIRTVYTLTDEVPNDWQGEQGRIDEQMIAKYVPDYRDAVFYISGTHAMVAGMKDILSQHVAKNQIKSDFFPGFV